LKDKFPKTDKKFPKKDYAFEENAENLPSINSTRTPMKRISVSKDVAGFSSIAVGLFIMYPERFTNGTAFL
jgi:hypothetical protein